MLLPHRCRCERQAQRARDLVETLQPYYDGSPPASPSRARAARRAAEGAERPGSAASAGVANALEELGSCLTAADKMLHYLLRERAQLAQQVRLCRAWFDWAYTVGQRYMGALLLPGQRSIQSSRYCSYSSVMLYEVLPLQSHSCHHHISDCNAAGGGRASLPSGGV